MANGHVVMFFFYDQKDERLSEEEVRAVSAHLLTNMPQMKLLFREGDLEGVTKMVRRGRLFNMKRTTPQDGLSVQTL